MPILMKWRKPLEWIVVLEGNFSVPGLVLAGLVLKKIFYLCRHYGLNEVADYWLKVVEINEYQQRRFVINIIENMFNTIAGKKIAIFGFAFKADTGDTRESPAIYVVKRLLEEKAVLSIYDPKAVENAKTELESYRGKNLLFSNDPFECADGADAIAILTDWKDFAGYDYEKIYRHMRKPAFIFDGRNVIDGKRLGKIGFNVFSIGKTPLKNL